MMQDDRTAQAAEAFSRKAAHYDGFGEIHPALSRMRAKARDAVTKLIPKGSSILELAAGTGGDALYFARQGYHIHATDIAPGMVAEIERKIAQYEREKTGGDTIGGQFAAGLVDYTNLHSLSPQTYDLAFSNMGGMNCAPSLAPVFSEVSRVLKPGGWGVFVLMPDICLWEFLAIFRWDWQTAMRRPRGQVVANVEGAPVPTWYFSPRRAREMLGTDLTPVSISGMGIFTPPADHKRFALRFPRPFRWLCALEDRVGDKAPFSGWGDFYILTVRKRYE